MDIVLFYILEIRVRQSNEFKTNISAIGDRTVAQIDFNRYTNRVIDLPTSIHCYQRQGTRFTEINQSHEILVLEIVIKFPSALPYLCNRGKKAVEKCFRTNWRVLIDEATKSWI